MRQISISYTNLKAKATELSAKYHYIDFTTNYGVFIYDANKDIIFDALPAGADETDFETNIKPTATSHVGYNSLLEAFEASTLTTSEVRIQEEVKKTGGHFQAQSFEVDTQSNVAWYETEFSFPMPISLLSAMWVNKISNDGDEVEFLVSPDTTTGSITAAVAIGATVIDVSQTVIDNAKVGYYLKLDDGTNIDDVGRVISIDKVNSQITIETATVNSFAVATPTLIKQTVKLVPKIMLIGDHVQISLGGSKIGGSYIPANTLLKARYNNLSGSAEKFSFILQYLY